MKPHFILDYETIGQDIFSAPVVNCSYFVFDWDRFTSDNPYTFNELVQSIKLAKFDLKWQAEHGYTFKAEDLDWWKEQGAEALKQLAPSADDITITLFCSNLYDYILAEAKGGVKGWWSRSNSFDPIFLARNFRDFSSREKLDFILPYWLVRDTRTYIDTRFDFKLKKNAFIPIDDKELWEKHFVHHNSIHDLAADILRLQRLERVVHLDEG